jgi:3-methylcrotonyl-CoA carboxylase alpha subunit
MFRRVLIANRGEIACRVIRTAHRLGIGTVAVFSDADAAALHVEMADHAVRIGPAPATESYLCIERIVAAARTSGAEAVHPGYGFLAENAAFVEAVEAAGLTFIGPSAAAMRAMGLKDAAKTLMAEAGVPVVPGYHGADQDDARLAEEADRIGYPLLIKAVAGGGGKGMRRVDDPRDLAEAQRAARGEAEAAFGNRAVLIEKLVAAPRHIEIQVFGDRHGEVVHLFERDCSLQRRHQKVVEEAPAPGMTAPMRSAMGAAAVKAAKAIGYVGAGTIEFIVDSARGLRPDAFWFMEMNTRLQVEHPVTEAITGQDLVEWQFRVAAGEPLPRRQDELSIDGHAIEARIYAENPERGFLPASGRLGLLSLPDDVRVDAGARSGDHITPFYDPLIAKMVAHGPSRTAALGVLGRALANSRAAGTVTNLAFLARLCAEPDFVDGRVDTGLIDRNLERLSGPRAAPAEVTALAALAALDLTDATDPLLGFTLWAPLTQSATVEVDGARQRVAIAVHGPDRFRIGSQEVHLGRRDGPDLHCTIDGRPRRFSLHRDGPAITVWDGAESHVFRVPDALEVAARLASHGDEIRAPMPGLVKHLPARAGQSVGAGDLLAVVEAMKMEHALTAPRAGRVAEVAVRAGAQVSEGALLLSLAPLDE